MSGNENIDIRRKRMLYRCWHRGTQEMDLILGNFANENLHKYNEKQLDDFEKLMDEQDTDLLKWILGQEPTPKDVDRSIIDLLIKSQLERKK